MDLPLPGKPEPPDSPCSSDVLRFWEDSVLDFSCLYPVLDEPQPESVLPPSPDIFALSTTDNGPPLGKHAGGTSARPNSLRSQFVWNCDENVVVEGNGTEVVHSENNAVAEAIEEPVDSKHDISTLNKDDGCWIPNGDLELPIICCDATDYNAVHDGEVSDIGTSTNIVSHDGLNNLVPLPLPPLPSNCDSCQLLRQIVHSNGIVTKRLEIHRTVGTLYHAICAVQFETGEAPIIHHELAELQEIGMAKPVLVDYFRLQEEQGHALVHDSNNSHDPSSQSNDCHVNPILVKPLLSLGPPLSSSKRLPHKEGSRYFRKIENNAPPRIPKSAMAIQRERTGRMTLEDLKDYMHLPIAEAARRLSVCPTVVKKVCRRNGLARWPYRKIRAIERTIDTFKRNLEVMETDDAAERAQMMDEIERLKIRKELASRGGAYDDVFD